MFVEPDHIQVGGGHVLHGCPSCTAKYITLVLIAPDETRAEYNILTCENVFKTYIQDLYNLYTGKYKETQAHEFVEPVTAVYVDEIIDPKEWLNCIKWSRYRREAENGSLELFVVRRNNCTFYYAIGPGGTLLVNRNNEFMKIHPSTVELLTGETRYTCRKPTLVRI